VARTIPGEERSEALAALATQLTGTDPKNSELFEQALTVARTIPGDGRRNEALAALAVQLADADPLDPMLRERALAVARGIPQRSAAQRSARSNPCDNQDQHAG